MKIETLIFLFLILAISCEEDEDEPEGIESQEGDAEEIYNKTYQEHQSALDDALFRHYSTKRRPTKNPSVPTEVELHFHIIHLQINEDEQTMTLHGHIYMTWIDEFLGWDPALFNGIRLTRAKRWQIWNPPLKVGNTVSGVGSSQEISKQAHVLINSRGNQSSKVEVYPTMSIKVGCTLDYSKFPYDDHKCTVRVFSIEKMTSVQLKFYHDLPPTLMLGWGNQSAKNMVGQFQYTGMQIDVNYFNSNGNYSDVKPVTAQQLASTWSIITVGVKFRRNHVLFNIGFLLPCVISAVFNTVPFFIPNIIHAIEVLVCNVLLQSVFLHELVSELPKTTKNLPDCVIFYAFTLVWNLLSIIGHVSLRFLMSKRTVPPSYLSVLNKLSCRRGTEREKELSWSRVVFHLRTLGGIANILIYISTITYFFTPRPPTFP